MSLVSDNDGDGEIDEDTALQRGQWEILNIIVVI